MTGGASNRKPVCKSSVEGSHFISCTQEGNLVVSLSSQQREGRLVAKVGGEKRVGFAAFLSCSDEWQASLL